MLTPRMSSASSTGKRDHLPAHRLEPGGGIGRGSTPLSVAGVELVEGIPESGQVEHVAAWVDLGDLLLFRVAVALFDDPEEPAGRVAQDSPEAGRVGNNGGPKQAGGGVVLMTAEEVAQVAWDE